jgi:DNA-binding CsgD family transcriptional regulator
MVCVQDSAFWDPAADVDASAAWSALWNGEWRIVDHVTGPPSHLILCDPAPRGCATRLLSRAEMRLALGRARGVPVKALAADSGRSTAAARTLLASVMQKLKLRCEAHLVLLFGGAYRDDFIPPPAGLEATVARYGSGERLLLHYRCPAWRMPPTLSGAECTVVRDILDGASQRDVARSRGTSQRTVANQMASVFRKVGVGSRVELFAALRPQQAAE